MRNIILGLIILSIILVSCAKTLYVPIENEKVEIEYIDKWQKDSIYIHDSIFIHHKQDTVLLERYKTVYKDRIVRDSIFITDSIKVEIPYPVEVVKEINRLTFLQNLQIKCGRYLLVILGGILLSKFLKKRFF